MTTPGRHQEPVPSEIRAAVLEAYQSGMCLTAQRIAEVHAPLREWTGVEGRLLAGRLAMYLGSRRLGEALHYLAWKESPSHPDAMYYHARQLLSRRGPLAAWEYLHGLPETPPGSTKLDHAHWLSLRGSILGALRDFDRADELMARAAALAPDDPWTAVERAWVLQLQDRLDEALEIASNAHGKHPAYPALLRAYSHLLTLGGKRGQAIELLESSGGRLECALVYTPLAALYSDEHRPREALKALQRYQELSPLLGVGEKEWLSARIADLAYEAGDLPRALEHASRGKGKFVQAFAARLKDPPPNAKRVVLDVPFIRQYHLTCAPTTMAILGSFFDEQADHLRIAEEICYDGTPTHLQHDWADRNGWVAREFTVTWDAAVALIDRGVPFALSTVFPDSAHLQAVVGYDTIRGTLLMRDPSDPNLSELIAETGLKTLAPSGPHGMVMIPAAKAHFVDDLELPEENLHELHHLVRLGVHHHDRTAAIHALSTLEHLAPGHRITIDARSAIAYYDGNNFQLLQASDEMLKLFPDSDVVRARVLRGLAGPEHRHRRVALLEEITSKPPTYSLFQRVYADDLMEDYGRIEEALDRVRRVIRRGYNDSSAFGTLGSIYWRKRDFSRAFEMYRFACCLDDKDERAARTYFRASRPLRRTKEALDLLEARHRRFDRKSNWPARSLYIAYEELHRQVDAFAVLDKAMELHPHDGDLYLFAAEQYGAHGKMARAWELMEKAKPFVAPLQWLRTSAVLKGYVHDDEAALQEWREIAEADPLNDEARTAITSIVADVRGPDAAREYLRECIQRFPHNVTLHQQLLARLSYDTDLEESEQLARRIKELAPAMAWAPRELALILGRHYRFDEAFAELQHARRLDPQSPRNHSTEGYLHLRAGANEKARKSFSEAIRLEVDDDYSIAALLESCITPEQRRDSLRFVEEEMVRQVMFGDGILMWARRATGVLTHDEILEALRRAHAARPDLWHAWSALVNNLAEADRLPEALKLATEAVERFPLLPRLRVDLAYVYQLHANYEQEVEALQGALEISPGWHFALRQLAFAHERKGHYDRALQVLEQAIREAPFDSANRASIADTLWHLGRHQEALDQLLQALKLEPRSEWSWTTLREWSQYLGKPELVIEQAENFSLRHPNDPFAYRQLANALAADERREAERIAALRRAFELDPHNEDLADTLASALAITDEFDAARFLCSPAQWPGGKVPFNLQGRAAWVEAVAGDLPKAVQMLERLVEQDPQYTWGWYMLHQWQQHQGNANEALKAARQVVRINPQLASAREVLADSLLATGDGDTAIEELKRAIQLDPGYASPGLRLLAHFLEQKKFVSAEEIYQQVITHSKSAQVLSQGVALATASRNHAEAAERFRQLLAIPVNTFDDRAPLYAAIASLVDGGLQREMDAIVREILLDDTVMWGEQVARTWSSAAVHGKRHGTIRKMLRSLPKGTPVHTMVLVGRLDALAATRDLRFGIGVWRHRKALRALTETWSEIGANFIEMGRPRDALRWLRDWKSRPDIRAYMLQNLAIALRQLGRDRQSAEISRAALTLPRDSSLPWHTVCMFLENAADGNFEEANTYRQRLVESDLPDGAKYYYHLADALMCVGRCSGASLLENANTSLFAARAALQGGRDRSYWRVVRKIAWSRGGLGGLTWWLGKHLA